MSNKIPSWHKDLQEYIHELGITYCLSNKDLLPWLTATLSGQFAICGYQEEFVIATLNRMLESYKLIKERIEKDKNVQNDK